VFEKIDIVELIGRYTRLKRVGREYVGLCPFHRERTPSFYVDPEKGVYHCFGCGASGNAITFLAEIEGITRREALRRLAEMFDLELPEERLHLPQRREDLYRVLEVAKQFYKSQLLRSRSVMDYLKGRGLTAQSVAEWELGYSPDSHSLVRFLLKEGFSRRELVESGVAYVKEGDVRDMMAGRVVFPIHDTTGRVVSFGGRSLDGRAPKYLNGRDTPIFKKSAILYGLFKAKYRARERGYFYLVEGYFDVLIMHQRGYDTTVAPLGTALSAQHARLLYRFAPKVFIVPDGDEAGRKAVIKSAVVLASVGVIPQVVVLPNQEDPASYLQVSDRLPQPMDVVDYILGERPVDPLQLKDRLLEIKPILRAFRGSDTALYEYYARKVSDWAGFRVEVSDPILTPRRTGNLSQAERVLLLGYYYDLKDRVLDLLECIPRRGFLLERMLKALKEGKEFGEFYEGLKPEEAAIVHGEIPPKEKVEEALSQLAAELEDLKLKDTAYAGDEDALLELYRRRASRIKETEVKAG